MTQYNQLSSSLSGDVTLLNSTLSTIDAGICVALTATQGEFKLTTGPTDFFGVTMESIAAGKYGRIRTEGFAVVTCAAAVTCGAKLKTDNAGKVLTKTAGTAQCGRACSTTDGASQSLVMKIENAFNA